MRKLPFVSLVALLASSQALSQDVSAVEELCLSEDTSDAAIDACNTLILDPDRDEYDMAEAFLSRGIKFHKLERREHALGDYDKAIILSPDEAGWYVIRGSLAFDLGDFDLALDDLDYAAYLAPDNAEVLYRRARALDMSGSYADAAEGYSDVIELVSDNPGVYLARAHAYSAAGNFVSALADFDQVIQLDPANAEAHNSAAWVLATSMDASVRDGAKAVRLALKAVELQYEANYVDTLAAAYAEIEAFAQATRTQQEATDLLRSSSGTPEQIADYESRLNLYQSNMPYREE